MLQLGGSPNKKGGAESKEFFLLSLFFPFFLSYVRPVFWPLRVLGVSAPPDTPEKRSN